MRRGFIFTLSVLLLFSLLLLFVSMQFREAEWHEARLVARQAVTKSRVLAEDIAADLNRLSGTALSFSRSPDDFNVVIAGALPSDANFARLAAYSTFLATDLSTYTNAAIALDVNALIDGQTELLFSNGLAYYHNYNENFVLFFAPGGDTNILSLDLNLFVNEDLNFSTGWAYDPGNDIDVFFRYGDNNVDNAIVSSGRLSSAAANHYDLNYGSGSDGIVVTVGSIDGNVAAVRIAENVADPDTRVWFTLNAAFALPDRIVMAYYDANAVVRVGDVNWLGNPVVAAG